MLVFNFAYFDDLFLNGDTSLLTPSERYAVFEEKPTKEIALQLSELTGNYKITKYQLDRDHGSVFDEWLKMGAPENMTPEELNYLQGKACPAITVAYLKLEGKYEEKLGIPVHGVQLLTLEKQY